jgi:hypothetical protein
MSAAYRNVPARPPFRTPMSLDRAHSVGTVLVLAVAVGALAVAATRVPAGWAFLPVCLGGVLGLSWAMAPRGLVVTPDELRVERRAWRALRVPMASIEGAEVLDWSGKRTLRLFGVGGFFGSYGLFHDDVLGRFHLYATRRGRAVLVRRRGTLDLVVTPDDVAGTVAAIGPPPPRPPVA